MARGHFKEVWRKACDPSCEVDDSRELLSYRTALFGFFGALLFVAAWLFTAGMAWWVVLTFLPIALLTFLGISRVIAELGLVYVYYKVQPYSAVLNIWGTPAIESASVTILQFMRVFSSIGKGFLMPAFTQSVRTVDGVVKPRRIAAMIWGAVGLGFVLSVMNTLYLGYTYGAYNLGNMGLHKAAPGTFNQAVRAIRNPIPLGGKGAVAKWAIFGALAMAALTLVRYWVPWWPIHPIGLAVQGNYGVTKAVFSILLAWAAKGVLMRIGGVQLYNRGKPFFIGLLAAQAVSTALVFLIDSVWFPRHGHNVHNY